MSTNTNTIYPFIMKKYETPSVTLKDCKNEWNAACHRVFHLIIQDLKTSII